MNHDAADSVIRYHEETKHHFHRSARSSGYMDWNNQPNPFRTYENTPLTPLPPMEHDSDVEYMGLYRRSVLPQPFDISHISAFMGLSMGLSAWKSSGGVRWALRMNPSSGNLHPTESYLILPPSDGIKSGLHHYHPLHHALAHRAAVPDDVWEMMEEWFNGPVFLAGLTTIFWREVWKYGERAFRYCNLDAGHALAALSFSAALQGWKVTALTALSDDAVETVLGLNRTKWHKTEEEHPDILCAVHAPGQGMPKTLSDEIIDALSALPCMGMPLPLSEQRVKWDIIYDTAESIRKPMTREDSIIEQNTPFYEGAKPNLTAANVIRRRRSAVAFKNGSGISGKSFLSILDKTLPRTTSAPFDLGIGAPQVDLFIFVHQVDGFDSGLYFFKGIEPVRKASSPRLLWEPVSHKLPLFLLKRGDFRKTAATVSCHQDIAGDSSFSLGMVARFRAILAHEPFRYRHLLWECGQIGQVLYLEAEAFNVRGTGIGCFFDDPVHDLLGLEDDRFQSLYHFTVGEPVEDRRLMTEPAGYR